MQFDRKQFFDAYRTVFGRLSQKQVEGLGFLLASMEADVRITDLRWMAYMLATVKHECANTWQPIEEYGKGKDRPYGKKVKVQRPDGSSAFVAYYGRGYVQLTWPENYSRLGQALGLGETLALYPERALEPQIAYRILSYGMRRGAFTAKKLADYINDALCDYKNARRIINGLDQASLIKGYAENFERFLGLSRIDAPPRSPYVPVLKPRGLDLPELTPETD